MSQDFVATYEDTVWSVYAYLSYHASTREEAEDLTQLTYERALKAWPRFDPTRASARTWLLAIARNALIDERRRDRPEVHVDYAEERSQADPAMSVSGPEESLKGVSPELDAALSRLQSRERDVLALRYGADLSVRQIGEMLGLTDANVHQISSRSLRKLRLEMTAHHGPEQALTSSEVEGS